MKLITSIFFIIAVSMASGILISEISYAFLICIKYLAYGSFDLEYSKIIKGLKVGIAGGGVLGLGIVFSRLLKIKGF